MVKFSLTGRLKMGRFKDYSYEQTVFLPINFSKQVLPGTFEYTLHNLIDNELDLSIFEERIHNDETRAPQVFAKQNTLRIPYLRHCTMTQRYC
jgi:hypothetical protein